MQNSLFLIGAGFNKDAKDEAGQIIGRSMYKGEYEIKCNYPLVNDLVKICFDKESLKEGLSIEECFATSLQKKDYRPLSLLYDALMKADYYLVRKLLLDSKNSNNCYSRFFEHFKESTFLTFNYDSMAELFLFKMKQWYPHDGYGVPVEVSITEGVKAETFMNSSSLVLHLHGSLCICTSEFSFNIGLGIQKISNRTRPLYMFEPASISNLFFPYTSPFYPNGYERIEHRVIAPVPDKADALRRPFIEDIHSKAEKLISEIGNLIIIGYNFSPHDRQSYHNLIMKLSTHQNAQALLVSPNARQAEERLRNEYPGINWQSVSTTFKCWVDAGFPKIT